MDDFLDLKQIRTPVEMEIKRLTDRSAKTLQAQLNELAGSRRSQSMLAQAYLFVAFDHLRYLLGDERASQVLEGVELIKAQPCGVVAIQGAARH